MKKYNISYLDKDGNRQNYLFEGEMQFTVKRSSLDKANSCYFTYEFTDFDPKYNATFEEIVDSIPVDGSDYNFEVIINENTYSMFKSDKLDEINLVISTIDSDENLLELNLGFNFK